MSPRAAWRLESLGCEKVYDYVTGKLDWMAAGLPTEGTNRQKPRAGDAARKDTPTLVFGHPLWPSKILIIVVERTIRYPPSLQPVPTERHLAHRWGAET